MGRTGWFARPGTMHQNDDQKSDLVIRIGIPRGEAARRWRRRLYWFAGLAAVAVLAVFVVVHFRNEAREAERHWREIAVEAENVARWSEVVVEEHLRVHPIYREAFWEQPRLRAIANPRDYKPGEKLSFSMNGTIALARDGEEKRYRVWLLTGENWCLTLDVVSIPVAYIDCLKLKTLTLDNEPLVQ